MDTYILYAATAAVAIGVGYFLLTRTGEKKPSPALTEEEIRRKRVSAFGSLGSVSTVEGMRNSQQNISKNSSVEQNSRKRGEIVANNNAGLHTEPRSPIEKRVERDLFLEKVKKRHNSKEVPEEKKEQSKVNHISNTCKKTFA